MRRFGHVLCWSSVILGAVILLLAVIRVGLERHAQHESARLLRDLKSVRIGDPAVPGIEAIVEQNHGRTVSTDSGLCEKADSCYEIYSGPPLALDRFLLNHPRLQRWAGLRPWELDALLEITAGRLSRLRVQVGANTGEDDEVLDSSTTLAPGDMPPSYYALYHLREGYSQVFRIDITSAAMPAERDRAFGFDISCAVAYGGCRRVCELVPSAWHYYERQTTAGGTPVSVEELGDQRCRKTE